LKKIIEKLIQCKISALQHIFDQCTKIFGKSLPGTLFFGKEEKTNEMNGGKIVQRETGKRNSK
jgi:hypothetical protein